MKCVICKMGETQPGKVTVTLDKEGATLVFRGVNVLNRAQLNKAVRPE